MFLLVISHLNLIPISDLYDIKFTFHSMYMLVKNTLQPWRKYKWIYN